MLKTFFCRRLDGGIRECWVFYHVSLTTAYTRYEEAEGSAFKIAMNRLVML